MLVNWQRARDGQLYLACRRDQRRCKKQSSEEREEYVHTDWDAARARYWEQLRLRQRGEV